MKWKFKFLQQASGWEAAECIIDAENEEAATKKLLDRDFTSYLVTKQDIARTVQITDIKEVILVRPGG